MGTPGQGGELLQEDRPRRGPPRSGSGRKPRPPVGVPSVALHRLHGRRALKRTAGPAGVQSHERGRDRQHDEAADDPGRGGRVRRSTAWMTLAADQPAPVVTGANRVTTPRWSSRRPTAARWCAPTCWWSRTGTSGWSGPAAHHRGPKSHRAERRGHRGDGCAQVHGVPRRSPSARPRDTATVGQAVELAGRRCGTRPGLLGAEDRRRVIMVSAPQWVISVDGAG